MIQAQLSAHSPENYCILEFTLAPIDLRTQLTLGISNFPTAIIRKHLEFYWLATMISIKSNVEQQTD